MLNLKKTAVAVLAFGSSAVFAGTMGPVCVPGNVTVPCEATAWDFGAQALYLQPTYSGLGNNSAHSSAGYTQFNDATPAWGWGFQVEGSYHYGMGSDVDLNWYHLSKSTDKTFTSDYYPVTQGVDVPQSLAYQSKPQWDQVNLEFGQHVDFSDYSKIRFHAGAQYSRLKNATTTTVVNSVIYDSRSISFNGFGPRAGADMSLNWGNGLSVYGKAAATLLVGKSQFSGYDGLGYSITPAVGGTYGGHNTTVVPELEGKLGATYTWAMMSGDVTIDAGYMWVDYINAHSFPIGGSTTAVGVRSASSNRVANSSFGLDGVYFGLKWLGNVA